LNLLNRDTDNYQRDVDDVTKVNLLFVQNENKFTASVTSKKRF